jgi:hypothetical protein
MFADPIILGSIIFFCEMSILRKQTLPEHFKHSDSLRVKVLKKKVKVSSQFTQMMTNISPNGNDTPAINLDFYRRILLSWLNSYFQLETELNMFRIMNEWSLIKFG